MKVLQGVDCYFVRDEHGAWGYFYVHANGLLVAHTDYGTYGYGWVAPRRPFKEFLVQLTDREYLLGKVSRQDVLDRRKTENAFKRHLFEMRREQTLSKERARELWDQMKRCMADELVGWGLEQQELSEADCYEWAHYDFHPAARAFVDKLFPLLQQELQAELAGAAIPAHV